MDGATITQTEAESALLGRASAGDRAAFGELVRLHQARVRMQLRRLTKGDIALADDLAQEAFVQAWRHIAGFRGTARFSTWLYRIAYHQFLMHQRSHPVQQTLPDSWDIAASEVDNVLRLDIEEAVKRLPEMERIAIVHCFQMDLSHEEAAAVLGLPLGTLKSHVTRGKARLRTWLAAWQAGEQK
ncbi:sigma-70 family RNA polymerase sigma factor [Chitinimonas viridis]|uniref:RNA polymerase sigma factor n=1 Tax=Chitinimonas viridis TaxID=664880 RepID=A0ABT8B9N3_9NEIS|nr:sigma-70 family RNA polymerase sigma factor [Chitinimonas viridis]MDN3578487.1 sigma-70 family RNA polymerase sigma factor [Chitinimonas viridis]